MSRIVETYTPRNGDCRDFDRFYDGRRTDRSRAEAAPQYRRYEDERRREDRYCEDRYREDRYPDRGRELYRNSRPSTPVLLMIFGAMYILSGIALFIIGAMAFLPLILAGAASVVVGIGYIKGWKIMWYVGMIMSLALIAVAAFMFLSGSLFPFFGFFLMIFAGAGIVCNLMPMIYLLLPNVRSYFGVGA